jgi:hypothetical protein
LKSLAGAPEKVGGYFSISETSNMTADKIKEELVGKPYYDSIDFQ